MFKEICLRAPKYPKGDLNSQYLYELSSIISKWPLKSIAFYLLFFFTASCCFAGNPIRITGQFTDLPASDIKSVSVKADFLKNGGESFAVSDYGSFTGLVDASGTGIATLSFSNFSYDFVIASETAIRMLISTDANGRLSITIEDSKENMAYQYARVLMNDQYRMYSYFANCTKDSCANMMLIEEAAFRHHRDSLRSVYPGTYGADVMCRFFDFQASFNAKQLPITVKKEILEKTPWNLASAYNSKIIPRLVNLYLDYAPDTGMALRQSLRALLNKTADGSPIRNRLANDLFDLFKADTKDDRLKEFLGLATDTASAFSDVVLKEKCRRYAKVMEGTTMPDISLPDSTGKELSLRQIAGNSSYTLLAIWNPDCPHCIASMPVLCGLYKKYHKKGLEIFAVSLNEDRKEWLKAMKENKCDWINVQATGKNKAQPENYFISYTPRFVLINKKGIIVKRQIATEDLEHTIDLLF